MTSTVMPTSSSATPDLSLAVSSNRLVGLWKLAKGFRFQYAAVLAFVSVGAVCKMLTFLLLAYIVDAVLIKGQATPGNMILYGSAFVGLAVIQGTFSFLARALASRVAERIARNVRNFLYDHLQHLSFSYHDKNRTGELIQRSTSDVDAVRRFYAEQILAVGDVLLPFTINVIAVLSLHTTLGLISMISIPFMLITASFFGRRIEKSYERFQQQDEVIQTMLQENLAGTRVVKAFARQDYEIDKFQKQNWEKFLRGRHLLLQHAVYWPTADTTAWIQLITGYVLGGGMAIRGEISVGTYLAFVGLLNQIIWPMRNLGRILVNAMTGLVSYGRLAEIFREPREQLDDGTYHPHADLIGAVEFRDVTLAYENEKDKTVLSNVSFRAEAGQMVALLGSTGSGKTSLVNLLPRFYEYTSGSITVDGVELNEYSRGYLRQQIGIVEQEPFLFSRSIRENITYGVSRQVSDDEVFAAAKAAAIHDVILSFPQGYDTLVGEKGVTLSGGQKQRAALARTLLKDPRILILDDATSSVDPETEGEIREALNRLMDNRTTFLIAHRIQSVMIADLILVMDQGRIVQQGTHDELMQQDGIYRKIFELQSRIEEELEREITSV